jgi:CheY-like chemotaxis protein
MPTLLVVDDNPDVLNLVARALQSRGYEILAAAGGEDALKMAAGLAGRIDLLITDIRMPGMDGPELWSKIRVLRPELRCLYISGFPQGTPMSEPFLAKPFTSAALVAKIEEILSPDRKHPAAQPPGRVNARSA